MVYVVGGAVRDALLGRSRSAGDLDLVVAHSAIPIARRVADRLGWAFYGLDDARDVARLVFSAGPRPLVCDISSMRGGTIETDLRARDFTVNALAFAYRADGDVTLIDVGTGQADLAAGLIRRVSAAGIPEDPVRLLRAVRFSKELGFPIEEETRTQILRMPGAITLASPERQRDEVWKMLSGDEPAAAIELMRTLGLLPYVLPEVAATDLVTQSPPHDKDVYRHTLAAVQIAASLRAGLLGKPVRTAADDHVAEYLLVAWQMMESWDYYLRRHFSGDVAAGRARADWLVWAALMHDVGKPDTRSVEATADETRIRFLGHEDIGAVKTAARLTALRFSRTEIELCTEAVRSHMRPHALHNAFATAEISRRARYRYFRDVGMRAIDRPLGIDVLFLALADRLATDASLSMDEWRRYLAHIAQMLAFVFSEKGVETPSLHPLIDGHTLMRELGISPGSIVGVLLDEIAEAQAAGDVTTPADALALARTLVRVGKV